MRQIFQYDPLIGYRFIPNLRAYVSHEGGGYLIRTNSQGFRCEHDFVPKKHLGFKRILLFGDSFTAGDGVSNTKRFGDLIEKKIENLEVYNFGLPGTGTDQQYLVYKEYSREIEHDLMIIAIFVDNIRRVQAHYRLYYNQNKMKVCYAKPYFNLVDGKLILMNVPPRKEPLTKYEISKMGEDHIDEGPPVPKQIHNFLKKAEDNKLLKRMFVESRLRDMIQKLIRYQPVPEYNDPQGASWKVMRAILENWICNHPKPVVLLPIPFYHHIMKIADCSGYQKRMLEVASELGCHIYDPLPDLFNYPESDRKEFCFSGDRHFTANGHSALADNMVPTLNWILKKA